MELTELLEKYDQGWVEAQYQDTGFFVKVRPMCQALQDEIAPKVKSLQFDKSSHKKIEVLDDDKFNKVFSKVAIVDWRGLTVSLVSKLIPSLKISAEVDQLKEIPCTPDSKHLLVVRSAAFQKFVRDVALDAGSVLAEAEEAEAKNSSTSHGGEEAEHPSPAPNV